MKKHTATIFFGIIAIVALLTGIRASVSFAETENHLNLLSTSNTSDVNAVQSVTSVTTTALTQATVNTVTGAVTTTVLKTMNIDPENPTVEAGAKLSLRARSTSGEGLDDVSWLVYEPNGGSINKDGVYVAPITPGVYHLVIHAEGYTGKTMSITVRAPIPQTTTTTTTSNDNKGESVKTTATTVTSSATVTTTLKTMSVDPSSPLIEVGAKQSFKVRSQQSGEGLSQVTWLVYESNGGSVTSDGTYTAPSVPGLYHLVIRAPGFTDKALTIAVRPPLGPGVAVVQDATSTTAVQPIKRTDVITTIATTTVSTVIANPPATTTKPLEKPLELPKPIVVATSTIINTAGKPLITTATATTSTKSGDDANKGDRKKEDTNIKAIAIPLTNVTTATSSPSASVPSPVAAQGSTTIATVLPDFASKVEDVKNSVADSKDLLIKIVDQRVAEVIRANGLDTTSTSTAALQVIRDKVRAEVNASLTGETATSPEKIQELGAKIGDSLREINNVVPAAPDSPDQALPARADNDLRSLVTTIADKATDLAKSGGDLLYKDTNKDGISDYESVTLYHIDPAKPSPRSVIDGREVSAGEKVLLGYDPAQTQLVKVEREEPKATAAPIATTYKVTDIAVTPDTKKLVLKGQALPNSYVTVYIYSTPIIVTVKTNADGEWDYTLDTELETGKHTVYTASVNNSGKIEARSPGFAFTKTAEAASLDTEPGNVQATVVEQPKVLETNNIYVIIIAFLSMVLVAVGLIGVTVR